MQKRMMLTLGLFCAMAYAQNGHHNHHAHMKSTQLKCPVVVMKEKQKNPSEEILNLMHAPMMCEKWVESKNADRDFLLNMIPHHQGAIFSSQALLKYSQNKKIRKIAKNIIKTQEEEIKAFREVLTSLDDEVSINYEAFNKEAKEAMDIMMQEMAKVKPSGDIDKDFVLAMISHHQGAIIASKQILKVSKNAKVKKFAEDIIEEQNKEIAIFKDWLKTLK
ncbi:DUF305 domain-containing protein [Helicobacter sp. faydin-H20]|uniref:DUF305 domain-containing protein n=1 Tax=Helicobacter anatolicus TaxID=2905874 RepID=UPI001E51EADD|nr:DUF305 domain-containing protein [Helicobacter anatolicus]MCE3037424.1 DUF305 domain-containing protein [Helicobacter anatolicus]